MEKHLNITITGGCREMNAKKILIVDDDWAVRELLKESLEFGGHSAVTVENGSQAYEQFRLNSFDMVFMDINMPKMDGIETVKAIRERHPDIPIIIMSGRNDPESIKEAFENGANDFLQKPFTPKTLMQKCERLK
jgi:CheY-like chemotaxis protein